MSTSKRKKFNTMAQALKTDFLLQSVGTSVRNTNGEYLGKVMEVTRNTDGKHIEYLILKSDHFFGQGNRFFAIAASSLLINITNAGNVILQLDEDELQFAKGIAADKCPKPDFKFKKSIYELYKYREPTANGAKKIKINNF